MYIVGSSGNHDISYMNGEIRSFDELADRYRKMVTGAADIIEADLAIEAGMALRGNDTGYRKGSKKKFFSE